ncbi:rCG36624, partial [Rattus norvegicus]
MAWTSQSQAAERLLRVLPLRAGGLGGVLPLREDRWTGWSAPSQRGQVDW